MLHMPVLLLLFFSFVFFVSPSYLEDFRNSYVVYVDNKVRLPLLHLGKAIIQG